MQLLTTSYKYGAFISLLFRRIAPSSYRSLAGSLLCFRFCNLPHGRVPFFRSAIKVKWNAQFPLLNDCFSSRIFCFSCERLPARFYSHGGNSHCDLCFRPVSRYLLHCCNSFCVACSEELIKSAGHILPIIKLQCRVTFASVILPLLCSSEPDREHRSVN